MNWPKHLKARVRQREPLKKHTSFRIGGPAKFFIEPHGLSSLKFLLSILKRYNVPPLLIGSGSNLLVNDKGVDAAVLHLSSPYFRRIVFKGGFLEAGAGVMLSRVISEAKRRGLSGAEFLAGIPGTVGGALAMNAGISEVHSSQLTVHSVGDLVGKVRIMDHNGNIRILDKKQIKFGYRKSSLAKYIILSARLRLVKKNKEEIENKIKGYIFRRRSTQDLKHYSAGCVFKNPEGESAGKLIDLCGLKGRGIGRAKVSFKHANFIINTGGATARDVLRLMSLIRKRVREKFNIDLEPEIKIWQ